VCYQAVEKCPSALVLHIRAEKSPALSPKSLLPTKIKKEKDASKYSEDDKIQHSLLQRQPPMHQLKKSLATLSPPIESHREVEEDYQET
jgi:hypothetical protein